MPPPSPPVLPAEQGGVESRKPQHGAEPTDPFAVCPVCSCIILNEVQEMASPPKTAVPRPRGPAASGLLRTRDAAALAACHPVTITRAIAAGELDAVRLGRRGTFRISLEALEKWMHASTAEETPRSTQIPTSCSRSVAAHSN